jgi:pimeloyl-ACP methyl ester carboxylesterase
MKISPLLLAAALASAAIVGAAFLMLPRPKLGRVPFMIWRAISSEAHGGQYANTNDVRIYFETYGSGAPVLVLHGGGGSLETMSNQIRALAPTHFVIAVDSRGQGRSTDSDAPLSYALMADDMLKLLDHLHIERVDIVGWSDGGIIALDMAAHHPERVGRIVVIGANYDAAGLVLPTVLGGAIPSAPLFYTYIAPDPKHWPVLYQKLNTMWATQPHYTLEQLGRIRAPALIIAGEFDIAKREHTNQLARAIPGSEEYIIPGGTHGVIWEKTDIVNAKMLQFFERPLSQ